MSGLRSAGNQRVFLFLNRHLFSLSGRHRWGVTIFDEVSVERPISEWQARLRGMNVDQLMNAWSAKADDAQSWRQEANFHLAVAERMKLLGFMSADLEKDERKNIRIQAADIIEKLQQIFANEPHRVEEFAVVTKASDDYYNAFGTPTARHYMYEQGIIDLLGDRLDNR